MIIIYSSNTGNVEKFILKLKSINDKITPINIRISNIKDIQSPYFIVTYTTKLGMVPQEVSNFISYNSNMKYLKGVSSSGDRCFGKYFALAADIIANKYNVPIIHKFELSGFPRDVDLFLKGVESIDIS